MTGRMLVLAACLAAAACSGPPARTATVTGRVTFGQGPLPGGRVLIKALAPDPQVMVASAMIEPDGTFTFTGAPVGPTQIAVETESVKLLVQSWEGGPANCPFKQVEIPKKYTAFDTSGLTLEVRPGKQEFNVKLDR